MIVLVMSSLLILSIPILSAVNITDLDSTASSAPGPEPTEIGAAPNLPDETLNTNSSSAELIPGHALAQDNAAVLVLDPAKLPFSASRAWSLDFTTSLISPHGESSSKHEGSSSIPVRKRDPDRRARSAERRQRLATLVNCRTGPIQTYHDLCKFLNKSPDDDEHRYMMRRPYNPVYPRLDQIASAVSVRVASIPVLLDEPTRISSATMTLEKLILIASLYQKNCQSRDISESKFNKFEDQRTRRCMDSVCYPVLCCLTICCQKDLRMFQARWGSPFPHSRFRFKCPSSGNSGDLCGFEFAVATQRRLRSLRYRPEFDSQGKADFLVRYQVKGFRTKHLISCFRRLQHEVRRSGGKLQLCAEFERYFTEEVQPVLKCLQEHCDDDVEYFIRNVGDHIEPSQFRQRICSGDTELCPAVFEQFITNLES